MPGCQSRAGQLRLQHQEFKVIFGYKELQVNLGYRRPYLKTYRHRETFLRGWGPAPPTEHRQTDPGLHSSLRVSKNSHSLSERPWATGQKHQLDTSEGWLSSHLFGFLWFGQIHPLWALLWFSSSCSGALDSR